MSKTNAAAAKALTSSNHFELFGLPPAFTLDQALLEKAYRDIQSQVHPDRFARSGDAERRASLQWTTRVNEAYRTLRDPVQRAKHLLELHGVDVAFETNTQMPTEFLLQQLDLREELDRARSKRDPRLLDELRSRLARDKNLIERQIAEALDARKDYAGAADPVRKLMFLEKVDAEIDLAYEAVE
ncbi:MAG TPA: Fe-S protein assembly co-chaperone HscB [Burkholderiales bacterium]